MASPNLLRGRISQISAVFAITTVTHDRASLFLDPVLAKIVAAEIECCSEDGLAETHAWVAMPDHVHWLFELRKGALGRRLQAFKSRAARAINAVTGSNGSVWQPGFYDHCLRSDEDLLRQARYLVMNPVRRGLVQRIEDYPFWWCRWIKGSADL